MAEDDSTPSPAVYDPQQLDAMIARLGLQQPAAQLPSGPGQGGVVGFLGDVGRALSGGGSGLLDPSPQAQDKAGANALLNMGINMLMASGPSYVKRDLGQILAYGLQGAQQGYAGSELSQAERLGAQQAGQQQQFDDRLKAIKAALPLLAMQQRAALPNPFAPQTAGGGGKPNTSIADKLPAYGGAANPPVMPKEYEPYFQEASAKTGIPVAVLKAQAAQESGYNPGATGSAGEIGIFQIKPDTAKNPGFGMEGVKNPAELRDPRSNILFGAQYLKARAGNADLSTPAGQAAALTAYNGGGDKNYVANVFRYMPAGGTAVAAASPPAAPGAPPAAPAPGRVVEAKVDTGTRTDATPGPVTPPPPPEPGPEVPDGDLNFEQFKKRHWVEPDAATYTVAPNPQILADRQAAAAAAQSEVADARKGMRAAEQDWTLKGDDKSLQARNTAQQRLQQAQQNLQQAQQNANQLQQEADKATIANRQKAVADQNTILAGLYKDAQDRKNAAALEAQRGRQAIDLEHAKTEDSFTLDTRKKLNDERTAAQETVDNLGLLDQLSKAAGEATTLDALSFGGKPLRQWLLERGIGTADQISRWGAQQAYEAAINQTVIGLRKGVSMGQLSDRDLSFLQGMSPTILEKPETREAITAYLRQAQLRKIRFADTVDELWDGGKGMSYGKALTTARQQLPEIVPKVPTGLSNADKRDWFTKNVPPGTLYRNSAGDLTVWPGMPGSQ